MNYNPKWLIMYNKLVFLFMYKMLLWFCFSCCLVCSILNKSLKSLWCNLKLKDVQQLNGPNNEINLMVNSSIT